MLVRNQLNKEKKKMEPTSGSLKRSIKLVSILTDEETN